MPACCGKSIFFQRATNFHQVIHGDLSARNILLTCDWTAKICNFGIAQRPKFQEESYAKQIPKVKYFGNPFIITYMLCIRLNNVFTLKVNI